MLHVDKEILKHWVSDDCVSGTSAVDKGVKIHLNGCQGQVTQALLGNSSQMMVFETDQPVPVVAPSSADLH